MIKKLLLVTSILCFVNVDFRKRKWSNYQNKKSIKWLCLLLFFCFFNTTLALDRYAVANGNWNATTTWAATSGGTAGASVPVAGDVVYIEGNRTVTVAIVGAACTTLNIALGSTLNVGGFNIAVSGQTFISGTLILASAAGTKTFTGLVTISGGTWTNSANVAVTFRGGITNNGTFTAGTGTHTFDTNSQALNGILSIPTVVVTGAVVNLTNNGTLTISTGISGSGIFTNSSAGTLTLSGACSITTFANAGLTNKTTTTNVSTALVNFTNTGTLNLNGTGTFTGITNNAGGIVNLNTSGTIASFNNAGPTSILNSAPTTMPITTLTATATGNTVNYTNATPIIKGTTYYNLQFSGTGTTGTPSAALTITGNLTNTGGGILNFGNVAVTINGTATQDIAGFTTTGSLTVSKTAGTATLTGPVIAASLTNSGSGTLSLGANLTHTINGVWSRTLGTVLGATGSVFRISGSVSGTGGVFTPAGGTVDYFGANQTIAGGSAQNVTYANLILSGSGIKAFPAAITTINQNLSIASGVLANLNAGFTHTANSLTLGGVGVAGGYWGSTSATAPIDFTNNTYFVQTTGKVNVNATACSPIIATGVSQCIGATSQPMTTPAITSPIINQINGVFSTATNPTAPRPGGETIPAPGFDDTTTCNFESPSVIRNYITTSFQVSATGNYTFAMPNNAAIDGMGYIFTGNFVIGTCPGTGTFVRGDDDTRFPPLNIGNYDEPTMNNVPLTAGVNYTLVTTDYDTNINGAAFTWNITSSVSGAGIIITPNWYAAATGGSAIGYGTSFNPVGVNGSGLPDTNTAITKVFYVGYDATGCRTPVNYVINPISTITLSSAPATTSQNVCLNSTITNITYTTVGATGASFVGLPAGVTGAWAANVVTISGAPSASGPFNYTVTLTGGCGNITATGSITVSSATTATAGTAINCGGFTANWTSITGATAYILDVSENNSFSSFVPNYQAKNVGLVTSSIITGLEAGKTYYFRLVAVSCGTSAYSNTISVLVKAATTNTWSGSWLLGTPTADQDIVFASGTFTSAGTNLVGCTCVVNSGVTSVTISSGDTMTITNGVNVADNKLTFLDDSSLIQINNATNSGIIRYERQTTPIRRYDFTFWSTPVFEPTLASVSPLTLSDKYHSYNGTGWVYENQTSVMKVGKGYSIRAPQDFSVETPAYYTAPFIGVPNNGNIDGESVVAGNYYLAGNPYPSAIDIAKFLSVNTAVLEGTVEFWSHSSNPVYNPVTGKYDYQGTDYLACNGSGSVSGPTGNYPDLIIAAGQAVSVKVRDNAPGGSKIIFTNDMRAGLAGKNSQFFKPGKTDESAPAKSRVWINLTNTGGVFKQLLLGYVEGATNEYEDDFDAITSDANAYADFYSIANGNNYVIQGKAVPFDQDDVVPLGLRIAYAGDFTIAIARFDGVFDAGNVYLEDKILNKTHNLKQGDYTFNTGAGVFNDRFVLKFKDNTLKTDDFDATENGLTVSVKDKIIKVKSDTQNIKEVFVYDISGKLLYQKNKVDSPSLSIERLQSGNQVLLVKVALDNNHIATKKVIF